MDKKICFFSRGFAFNRLNRLRYYEKIFPKDVEIFLFTTDKYAGKEKENYQYQWTGLSRTKIIVAKYDFKLPVKLRNFCRKERIDRLVNLGNRKSFPLFVFATFLSKTNYFLSLMGGVPKENSLKKLNLHESWEIFFFYFFSLLSEKIITNDFGIYERYKKYRPFLSRFFFISKKIEFLPVVVNTDIFIKKSKREMRKKLNISQEAKVAIFVGRTARCADVLSELIKNNKDILFLIIGRVTDDKISQLKTNNIIHYEKIMPEMLVDYYNASDIHIALHDKKGAGLGLAAEESLSCGIPTIVPFTDLMENSPSLFQINLEQKEADKVLKGFFNKSKKERERLSEEAEKYATRNFSANIWKDKYIESYIY